MLNPGDKVDQFEVTRQIGRGGMGAVYLARDTTLGRKVALKVVNPRRLGSAEAIERFLFEARATAQFSHPHIVTVFAAGEHQGNPYIALEYLEGQNLKQRMRQEWPSLRESLRFGLAIADALKEAHQRGILHRDLKPENVLIPKDGRLRVVDFGLAKVIGDEEQGSSASGVGVDPVQIRRMQAAVTLAESAFDDAEERVATASMRHPDALADELQRSVATIGGKVEGKIIGSPLYMAPEQWLGQTCTGATDVWALGLILYELISGHRPYSEPPPLPLALKVVAPEPVPRFEVGPNVPPELVALVHRCVDKAGDERPAAGEVAEALGQMLHQRSSHSAGERSPFRGLLPFGERHADFFYGRDDEIAAFLERMREEPILPVVGPSGAGKSSFVQAGIIPRLREQGALQVLSLRPGTHPFVTLAARLLCGESTAHSGSVSISDKDTMELAPDALAGGADDGSADHGAATVDPDRDQLALAEQLTQSPQLLSLKLHRLAVDEETKVLLFIDQLEELYTLVDDDSLRERFMQAICTAADDPQGPVRVVLTLRDDFLGRMAVGAEAREVLGRVAVLRSPAPNVLEETLLQPVRNVGFDFEDPELPREMVAEVQGEPACLPLLQFAAQTLWERRDKHAHLLRRTAYDTMGGVAGALAEHADGVLDGMSAFQVQLARELLLRLVTTNGTRRVLAWAQSLDGLGPDAPEVLARLTHARLITVRKGAGDEGGEAALELAHEALIHNWARLARWIDESREDLGFITEVDQAAELWHKRGRHQEEVWQGAALHEALRHSERCSTKIPERALVFLEAGERKERWRVRRRRGLVSAVFMALLLVAGVLALQNREVRLQRNRAEQQRAAALSEGARRALEQGALLEGRTKLRLSLESEDSTLGRLLWWRLSKDPLIWKRGLGSTVYDVAYSPDGRWLAAACGDHSVYLFDAQTRTLQRVFRGHRDQVFSVVFAPDGQHLASASWSGEVWQWLVDTGAGGPVLGSHSGAVRGLDYSHNGDTLVSGSEDGTVKLWDATSGALRRSLEGPGAAFWSVQISADGRTLATGGKDGVVLLWDVERGTPLRTLGQHDGPVYAVAFVPGAKQLVSGGADRTIRVWDTTQGGQVRTLVGHTAAVAALDLSADGRWLASASYDKSARIWDLKSGSLFTRLEGHTAHIRGISFSPDATRVTTAGQDNSVRLWRLLGAPDSAQVPTPGASTFYGAAFSPDGRYVAAGGNGKDVRLWNLESGTLARVLTGPTGSVWGVAFSPEGDLIAAAGSDRQIALWEVNSGQLVRSMLGHTETVTDLAFSPDGRLLASASYDRTARLWEVASGRQVRVLSGHTAEVWGIAFSPNGQLLATGGEDRSARIWDLKSGLELQSFDGHGAAVEGVSFSPDGTRLATGSDDRSVRVWNLASGEGTIIGEQAGRVYWLSFHPDGRRIGAPDSSHSASIWDPVQGSRMTLTGHRAEVNYLRFNRSGELAATTSDDGTLRIWNVSSGRPYWRAPALLSSPPLLYSHRGAIHLEQLSGQQPRPAEPTAAWRTALQQRAHLAAELRGGRLLCVATYEDRLELWDMLADTKLLDKPVPGVQAVAAIPGGCLVRAGGSVFSLDAQGGRTSLVHEGASAIWSGEQILVAASGRVSAFTPAGQVIASYPADVGVTAMASNAAWLLIGYSDGNLELIDVGSGRRRTGLSFEDVPASPVERIVIGQRDVLVVGYANGLVGLWNLATGKRLESALLHGPVVHLLYQKDRLFAATELGDNLVWDLSVLGLAYCDLLGDVWGAVPSVWENGLPVLRQPPADHPCAAKLAAAAAAADGGR